MSGVKDLIEASLKELPKADADRIKKVLKTKLKSEEKKQAEAAKAAAQQGIHKRVVNGKTRYDKVNTCMPKGPLNTKKVARMEEHQVRHPNDAASKKHLTSMRSSRTAA